MRRIFPAFVLPILALVSWQVVWADEGQKLPGRMSEYHKVYGLWDVACDTAMDGTGRRCYVQYVDVYRPRPEFAAAMVEVVMHEGADGRPDPHIRFDLEPGLSFRNTSVFVQTADGPVPLDVSACPENTCRIQGDRGREILKVWRRGSTMHLSIGEGRATPAELDWPLESINLILDDFAAQRAARGLP